MHLKIDDRTTLSYIKTSSFGTTPLIGRRIGGLDAALGAKGFDPALPPASR